MLNKLEKMDNNKKVPLVLGISITLIILIIVFSVSRNNGVSYNEIKIDSTKGFVYTINSKKEGLYRIEVPYVNIKDSFGKSINEDIDFYVSDFIDNEKLILSYDYNINGKVLSLVIKTVDYNVKSVPKVYFKTYNINLEDLVLLSDEELLSIYSLTDFEVSSIIEKQFSDWYNDEIKEGYINEDECDYDCFLGYRDVEDYLENVVYYIKQGKLVAYKPFEFYSIFGEENYFKESDFEFVLSE